MEIKLKKLLVKYTLCCLSWLWGIAAVIMLVMAILPYRYSCLSGDFDHFYKLSNLFVITFSLNIAIKTYVRAKKVDAVKGLLDLRNALTSKENMDVHTILCNQGKKDVCNKKLNASDEPLTFEDFCNKHEQLVDNYLGTLELIKIYLDEGIVDENSFYNQFGYRVENVQNIRHLLNKENSRYWIDLFELCDKIPELKENSKKAYTEYINSKH